MADLAGAELLRLGREAEKRIDLSVGEQLQGIDVGAVTQSMSLSGSSPIFAAMIASKVFWPRPGLRMPTLLALQVADGADGLVREQLEAAGMHARQHRDRLAGIEPTDDRRREKDAEIELAVRITSLSAEARLTRRSERR